MNRVLLYVHFNSNGELSEHVIYQLSKIRPLFNKVVFITNSRVGTINEVIDDPCYNVTKHQPLRGGSSSGGARSHKVGFSYGSTTGFSDPVRKSLSQNTMNTLVYILDVLLPGLLRCWRKFRRISII